MNYVFVALLFAGFFLLGYYALGLILKKENEKLIFAFPTGLGLSVVILFTMNTLFSIKLSSFLIFGVVFCLTFILAILKRPLCIPKFNFKINTNVVYLILFGFVFMMILHAILVPIYRWDAFLYHLPIAKQTFLTGFFPSNITTAEFLYENAYPALGYFNYALFYFAAGKEALLIPKVIPLIFGLLMLLVVYFLSQEVFNDSKKSVSAVILFLASYYYSQMLVFENTDVFLGFYILSAFYFLIKSIKESTFSYYPLIALMLVFSFWVKYTALLAIFIVGVVSLIFFYSKKTIDLKKMAISIIVGLLILPILIRNYLITNNPIFPSMPQIFGGVGIEPWYVENVLSLYYPLPFSQLPTDLIFVNFAIFVPFTITWIFAFEKTKLQRIIGYVCILFLLLAASLMRNPAMENTYRYFISVIALISIIISPTVYAFFKQSFNSKQKLYFVVSTMILLSFALAVYFSIISDFFSSNKEILVLSAFFIAAIGWVFIKVPSKFYFLGVILLLFPAILSFAVNPISYYQSGQLGTAIDYQNLEPSRTWMIENLDNSTKMLSLTETRYLFPVELVNADTSFSPLFFDSNLEESVEFLKNRGITHVWVTEYMNFYPSFWYTNSTIYQNLDSKYFELVYSEEESIRKAKIYKII